MRWPGQLSIAVGVLFAGLAAAAAEAQASRRPSSQPQRPVVPRTWDDSAVASLQLPLAHAAASPRQVGAAYYYRMPVRPVYQSYPIYAPGREPPGYMDSLRRARPRVVFDAARLRGEAEWIRAGEMIFDAPIAFDGDPLEIVRADLVRRPAWYEQTNVPVTRDGIMPYARYVIRKQGLIEVGSLACAMCHTRVMPDGGVLKGAQGNFPFDRAIAALLRARVAASGNEEAVLAEERTAHQLLFKTPWLSDDRSTRADQMSLAQILSAYQAIPPGVAARHGTGIWSPAQIPDLIGLKDRKYLDRSGLVRHRSIGDVMRYAALNQDADLLASYGGFRPFDVIFGGLPEPTQLSRYSDEQLYALALYIYSLMPPANPNPLDSLARRGRGIFEREECGRCHTPPLYTNNKLTPALGFQVPARHFEDYDIVPISVGTDPGLALGTRRGTGYYKVPSLRGVWYRGPFEHNGSVATLEDWFNPRRVDDGYVPTGFKGADGQPRPLRGHRFGLLLPDDERRALIAFLRTL